MDHATGATVGNKVYSALFMNASAAGTDPSLVVRDV